MSIQTRWFVPNEGGGTATTTAFYDPRWYLAAQSCDMVIGDMAGVPRASRQSIANLCRAYADALETPGSNGLGALTPYQVGGDGTPRQREPFKSAAEVTAEIVRLRAAALKIEAITTNP